jgi:PKD repeat protein
VGGEVRFTDASANATTWAWDFGDRKTSDNRHPFHTYTLRGTYTVTLRVSDGVTTAQTNTTITVGERARLHLGK